MQWTIAYVAFAFALIEVLDVVAGSYGWPRSAMRIAFGVLALGFVVVLVLAWYHGERGAQRVTGIELLILALLLAIGGGLLWRVARVPNAGGKVRMAAVATQGSAVQAGASAAQRSSGAGSPAAPVAAIPAKSIAVLPFANLSGGSSEKYFSVGITEEILNALAQIPDLKVTGRTSAFQFSSKDEDLRKIGKTLGVADVLIGSVRKAGDEVRINVQLVDRRTGYQRWSEKYDRKLTNIFTIEDAAGALFASHRNPEGNAQIRRALTIDPDFGLAHILGFMIDAQFGRFPQAVAHARSLDSIRNDPRFNAVLKKMGLPYKPVAVATP